MAKLIIFTDLDGTLLHPMTYSFEEAMPALELLKERDIPLILCSSKTRAEIEIYREKIGNEHPFISENGGGIFIPKGYFKFAIEGELRDGYIVITLGRPYSEIRKIFIEICERLGIQTKGFGDMTAEEIADLTALPLVEARFAKQRDFDEPFIFEVDTNNTPPPLKKGSKGGFEDESKIEEFLKAIEDSGLHWTRGRFYHILGNNDKGKAVEIIKGLYENAYGKIKTIGLGNSFNDLPLLQQVDYPVLVKNEDGSYDNRISLQNLIKADGIGPEGWNSAIMRLIG